MKKLSAAACLISVFLLFTGCAEKDSQKQTSPKEDQAPVKKAPVGC